MAQIGAGRAGDFSASASEFGFEAGLHPPILSNHSAPCRLLDMPPAETADGNRSRERRRQSRDVRKCDAILLAVFHLNGRIADLRSSARSPHNLFENIRKLLCFFTVMTVGVLMGPGFFAENRVPGTVERRFSEGGNIDGVRNPVR